MSAKEQTFPAAGPRILIILNSFVPSGKTGVDCHHRNNHPASFGGLSQAANCVRDEAARPVYFTLTNMPQAAASAAPAKTSTGLSQNVLP